MIKKIISLLCCIAPIGVMAEPVLFEGTDVSTNGKIYTNLSKWQDAINADNTIVIKQGTVISDADVDATNPKGVEITGSMIVGQASDVLQTSGNLYVMSGANTESKFTVSTVRDVSVGALLSVLDGWGLEISGSVDGSGVTDAALSVGSGPVGGVNVADNASLNLSNLKNVQINGPVTVEDGGVLSVVDVGAMSMGVVNANGTVDLTVSELDVTGGGKTSGDLNLNGFIVGGTATLNVAGDINVLKVGADSVTGTIQNNSEATIVAAGNINVAGNLENSGTSMTIKNAALTVDGTMKNDAGKLSLLDLQSWTVSGMDAGGYSFVNSADFAAVVNGAVSLANGWNLAGMSASNSFSLTTQSIDLGNNKAILNHINDFELNVTAGDLVVSTVTNETSNAQMKLDVSGTFSANYLADAGALMNVKATDIVLLGQSLDNVQTSLYVSSDASNTSLTASGSLTAGALVSNIGNLTLRAPQISLVDISNSGTVSIGSSVGSTGVVEFSGNVTNISGTMDVVSKSILFGGLLNGVGGSVNISGSDSNGGPMSFGGIDVSGANVSIAASIKNIDVVDGLQITGGALNFAASVKDVTVGKSVSVANGDIVLGGTDNATGDLNVLSDVFTLNANDKIGAEEINAYKSGYSLTLVATNIEADSVSVGNASSVTFGSATKSTVLSVSGLMDINQNGTVGFYADTMTVGSLDNDGLIKAYGNGIVATNGTLDVAGVIRFEDSATTTAGVSVLNSDSFTLRTLNADIMATEIDVDSGKTLTLASAKNITVSGGVINDGYLTYNALNGAVTFNNTTTNNATFAVNSDILNLGDFVNAAGSADFTTRVFNANSISNKSVLTVASALLPVDLLTVTGQVENISGTMNLYADTVNTKEIKVTGGVLNLYSDTLVNATNSIYVSGSVNQGGTAGNLNLINVPQVTTKSLTINGSLMADGGSVLYSVTGPVVIGNPSDTLVDSLLVSSPATVVFDVKNNNSFKAENIENYGDTTISAKGIFVDANIVNSDGFLDLNSFGGIISANSVNVTDGAVTLSGLGLEVTNMFNVSGVLGQGASNASVNILSDDYIMDVASLNVGGISQDGELLINSSDVYVGGNIDATNLRFAASPENNWMNVVVDGSVSGNVDFIGLGKMNIAGNYIFNDDSSLNVAVLPYATGSGSSDINYWASVSLKDDATFGQIISPMDANPLISVGGKFVSDLSLNGLGNIDSPLLQDGQFGIDLFDIVDSGSAIWLLHAENGVYDFDTKIRNLNVKFCNADGSICVPYFNDLNPDNPNGLPAYVSVRDTDNDGLADSLYIVFDNRFGGPVEVFGIQPIVARKSDSTKGAVFAAGALDNMVAGQLEKTGFFNRTPIEAIPVAFQGTNLSDVATELYNRMENYVTTRDGYALAQFSSLFENYEIEQIMASMVLNEHTSMRSFEDRLVDEFIWNRNRNLKKTWVDVDYGMFYQNTISGNHADGNRFSISGGFDWQESNTLILGLMGHVSHVSSKLDRNVDLSYGSVSQTGHVDSNVSDTNIGFGGYVMKTLGDKYRFYGNLMMDIHVFDIKREQTFVDSITGDGNAFSVMSELGLLHDILNQYIVGNAYARVGYNFGASITERAGGSDYMHMQSDGYLVLTPGYSLTAHKRIYPSAWFQIRPYASIGIEYDVLGSPDTAEYRFATTDEYSEYGLSVDPLWANIGGGIEMLSAHGMQFGLDYRYQYNADLQLHNIKVSGSYRF